MQLMHAGFLTAFGLILACPSAQAQGGLTPGFDDQKGRYVNFEVGPVRSIVLDEAHGRLLVLNQPGHRLAVFDPATLVRRFEIPIGLGAASLALRPGTGEAWIVDRVSGCVQVLDLERRALVRTIRVASEPHGIAFSPDGQRAWISCSGSDSVVAIDADSYSVAQTLDVPADTPRGIAYQSGRAWVASFLSGNGTAARGTIAAPDAAVAVGSTQGAGLTPLPDLDLFPILLGPTPGADVLDPLEARAGLGTVLFDVVGRPGRDEVWIPGTEALNAQHRGETSFVGGQVVSNRIAIVSTVGNGAPLIVDLDALAPAGVRCAQPTSLVFDPVRPRVYVCAYGSDVVAVLDLLPEGGVQWAGHVAIPAKQGYPRGSGPRSATLDAAGTTLWVFNRNDLSIVRIALGALPQSGPPFAITAAIPVAVGFDAASDEETLGRHLFTDARNSGSLTSSCASCHVDAHTDGVVWDLSRYLDPEGTPPDQMTFGLDVKGPLITQTTRRQEDTGPYHWRGERRTLNDFNATFVTLLDRLENGQPRDIGPEFQYLRHFINRIAIPANPLQQRDRTLRPDEVAGAEIFLSRPVLNGLTCNACHVLPLGSSGEVVAFGSDGVPTSFDVPSLRRVADREQPVVQVGGEFGQRPRAGGGLMHAGVFARLEDVLVRTPSGPNDTHAFALTALEAQQVAAFLRAFDSGLAPATTGQVTAHAANWTAVRDGDLAWLLSEAEKGHCDLVAFRTPLLAAHPGFVRTALYDPTSDRFRMAGGSQPWTSARALLLEAAADRPVTFLGVPLGRGLTAGIDRDADGLLDADERTRGTNPDNDDTDNDHFPDGYEVEFGNNPLVQETTVNDHVAPSLVGAARVVYATTNTVKLEFRTNEMCRVHVGLNGGTPVQRLPLDHRVDREHWVVLGDLTPGTTYVVNLQLRDPALNIATDSTTVITTLPRLMVEPVRASAIRLKIEGTDTLVAEVQLSRGAAPAPVDYHAHGAVYRLALGATMPELVAADAEATSNANGLAVLNVPLGGIPPMPGVLFFVLTDVVAPTPADAPYVRAFSTEVFDTLAY